MAQKVYFQKVHEINQGLPSLLAVATVLSNWNSVLQAISMASSKFQLLKALVGTRLIQSSENPKAERNARKR